MRRLALLLAFLPTLAIAQTSQPPEQAPPTVNPAPAPAPAKGTTCIGGKLCPERRLRVPLEDRPVIEVRFRAHDAIGQAAGGVLRLKIDGNVIRSGIDIPRAGQTFTIDVDEMRGRYLVFEPEEDDEVEISGVEVIYGRERGGNRPPRDPYDPPRGGGGRDGWRSYPRAAGCIGGTQCRQNGNRITIALDSGPVLGVRFYAHDNVGARADGKLTVRIDSTTVESYIDVQRNGKRHDLEVDNVRGTRLVIETASDDEVEIRDVEVLYGRGGGYGGGGGRYPREITDEGGCIGGDQCGGRRARIRIPLRFRPVESIRFYARDDVGTRAGGELRIRIDDEIVRDYLDIPREGRTFTIDANGVEGEYLIIEVTEDDEVVVKDIRVRFGERDEDD